MPNFTGMTRPQSMSMASVPASMRSNLVTTAKVLRKFNEIILQIEIAQLPLMELLKNHIKTINKLENTFLRKREMKQIRNSYKKAQFSLPEHVKKLNEKSLFTCDRLDQLLGPI